MQWFTKLENTLFYDKNAHGKDLKQPLAHYVFSLPVDWAMLFMFRGKIKPNTLMLPRSFDFKSIPSLT